jgi:hypothetical protein
LVWAKVAAAFHSSFILAASFPDNHTILRLFAPTECIFFRRTTGFPEFPSLRLPKWAVRAEKACFHLLFHFIPAPEDPEDLD